MEARSFFANEELIDEAKHIDDIVSISIKAKLLRRVAATVPNRFQKWPKFTKKAFSKLEISLW